SPPAISPGTSPTWSPGEWWREPGRACSRAPAWHGRTLLSRPPRTRRGRPEGGWRMAAEDRLDLPVVGERQSLREQVAQALRAALITGEMRPGVVYSAPVLAAQFGVSATPVREA